MVKPDDPPGQAKAKFEVVVVCMKCCYRWSAEIPKGEDISMVTCPKCRRKRSIASFIPDGFNG